MGNQRGSKKEIEAKFEFHSNNDPVEKRYSEKLTCSKSTKKLITDDCIEEFLKHHPELHGSNVTQNMILTQIANFYLKS